VLNPGQKDSVSIRFTPKDSVDLFYNANLIIETKEIGSNTVELKGHGVCMTDLSIVQINTPLKAFSNSKINISWKVKNIGKVTTAVYSWGHLLSLYSIKEKDIGVGRDTILVETSRVNLNYTNLLQGESFNETANYLLSRNLKGKYFLKITADSENDIKELNENNNSLSSNVIEIEPPLLSNLYSDKLSLTNSTDTIFSGKTVNVEYTVKNIGKVTTDVKD